jgi:hypothetical protein
MFGVTWAFISIKLIVHFMSTLILLKPIVHFAWAFILVKAILRVLLNIKTYFGFYSL